MVIVANKLNTLSGFTTPPKAEFEVTLTTGDRVETTAIVIDACDDLAWVESETVAVNKTVVPTNADNLGLIP